MPFKNRMTQFRPVFGGLLLVLCLSSLGFGQGASYPGLPLALARGGLPLSGATVTVCSGNVATNVLSSPPCSPYAAIYSDPALTVPIAQPGFKTDGLGNYPFFTASASTYTICLTGSSFVGSCTVWNSPNVAGGTASFQVLNSIPQADLFTATDIGAKVNAAIASTTTGSCHVEVAPGTYSFSTQIVISRQCRLHLGAGTYAYSGTGQAISITADGAILEGDGRGNTNNKGTVITVSNTSANGIDANAQAVLIQNLQITGPTSGAGVGLILTANNGQVRNVAISGFGSDGLKVDGTRGNSNNVTLDRARSYSNGGAGFNLFGTNGNVVTMAGTDAAGNTSDGYLVQSLDNACVGCHAELSHSGINYDVKNGNLFGTVYSEEDGVTVTTSIKFDGGNGSNLSLMNGTTIATANSAVFNNVWKAGGRNEAVFDWGQIMPTDPGQQTAFSIARTTGTNQLDKCRVGQFLKSGSAQSGGLEKCDSGLNLIYGASGTGTPIMTIAANCTATDISGCTKTWTGNADGTSTFGTAVNFSGVANANGNLFANANLFIGASGTGISDDRKIARLPASLTTTAATSDNVTVTGASASSHCSLTPTNASAATNVATTYISAKTTDQITVTHTATASMTYDVLCTVN